MVAVTFDGSLAQLVERPPRMRKVTGSKPVRIQYYGPLVQLVERNAGSVDVIGSNPICVHYGSVAKWI